MKGPIHWPTPEWTLVNIIIIVVLFFSFLISFLYPLVSYKSYSSKDWTNESYGQSFINIKVSVPGTLYVNNIDFFPKEILPDDNEDDDYDDDYTEIYDYNEYQEDINVYRLRFNLEHNGEKIGGSKFIVWMKFELPQKGDYYLYASDANDQNPSPKIRFFGKYSDYSCCCLFLVLPLLSLIYLIVLLIMVMMRKKLRREKGLKVRKEDDQVSRLVEPPTGEEREYHLQGWKDNG